MKVTGFPLRFPIPPYFLRSSESTPDSLQVEIATPGGTVEYPIPVMKSQRYTIDEIFEKGLLLLIPFYIFSHESRFHHYNQNPAERKRLTEEYQYIMETLEELTQAKQIDEYTKCTLIDMSKKVLAHIAKNYKNVREGVKMIMGGKVLEYEAKTIKNEGRQEGRLEMLFDLVRDNLLSLKDAAARIGLSEEVFLQKMKEYKM